ncbi:transcriptional regulator, Crp/Fnr family [hydrothermal vent metagenome]|uniref:Transcriptional regulator, Crp/Fnr family n=1 Tax=hydrothermal vent metagenome TaxID=652676 RepID=A0A3B0U5K5_9ZZZZ
MRIVDLPEIRQLSLFESMSDGSFSELMNAAYLQNFPAQVDLIHEGDNADFLFFVVDGCVELYANANGREGVLALVRPVGSFILAAVLEDSVYLMSARTNEKSRILMIPAQNVRDAFKRDDAFARAIVLELSGYFRAVVKEYKDLRLRTGVERLANRLLKYHISQGAPGFVQLPCDKKTLASILGMTPENLSRAFGTIKPYGVDVVGQKIVLGDVAALTVLAKPNPLIDDPST